MVRRPAQDMVWFSHSCAAAADAVLDAVLRAAGQGRTLLTTSAVAASPSEMVGAMLLLAR